MKLKLISALSALAIGGGCLAAIPAILNTTNNVSTQKADNNKIIVTDNIKHSANVQVVNSVDQIVVENLYNTNDSSAAIVNNNGKQEIYVWGSNSYGQLGLGDTNQRLFPILLDSSSLGNYLSIKEFRFSSTSSITAIVNTSVGEQIYVWGANNIGQLGLGNANHQSSPILFNTAQFGDFEYIKEISFADTKDSTNPTSASFAVLSTNIGVDKIYVWGDNSKGKLGLGDENNRLTPTLFPLTVFGLYTSIKKIEFAYSSYAIVEVNPNIDKIYVWGTNNVGQLGLGDVVARNIPTELTDSFLLNAKVKFMEVSNYDLLFIVITKNGVDELYSSGDNGLGGLGHNNATKHTFQRVTQSSLGGANEIINICAYQSTYANVKVNGVPKIYVWGRNSSGELGLGTVANVKTPTLFENSRLGNFIEFYDSSFNISNKYGFTDSSFAYVKTALGDKLYTWGANNYGQLGLGGSTPNYNVPTEVTTIDLSTAKIKNFAPTIGFNKMFVLDRNGQSESYATGRNGSGQIGNNNTTNATTFTQILPIRYTKPESKLINPTTEISSAQALALINPNNTLNRTELDKYVDTTTNPFPAGSILSIDPTTTSADYKNGVLNLGITTNQYNDLLIVNTVAQPKTFNVTINGFKPVTDISTNPVTTIIRDADGTNIDKIYDQVVDSTYKVVNRNLLEYYFDLSSIPPTAVIHLYRNTFGNDMEAKFTLTSSQVYGNTGLVVDQLYVKSDLVLTLTNQINLPLIISLSVVGGLLLIGSIVAIALVKKSSNKLII